MDNLSRVLRNFDKTSAVHRGTTERRWLPDLSGNVRRIAETLRVFGPRTRAELVSLTGLSRPTVSAALADLNDGGVIDERVARNPGGGRPASRLWLTRRAGLVAGLDVGRGHVRVAVADLGHTVLAERTARSRFDLDERPGDSLGLAVDLLEATLAEVGAGRDSVVGVGLGIPAPVTRDGRIGSPALLPGWAELRPGEQLARTLGTVVHVENDANLGALGESIWGAGRDCADLVYVQLATGVGAGIILDGRLHRGSAGTAGELGHVTLDSRGAVCRCGNRGCVELAAGGQALLRDARVANPELTDITELVRRAEAGDAGCLRLIVDAGSQLGFALGTLVNLLNPRRIVLGGELGGAVELLREPLRRGLAESAMAGAAAGVEVVRGAFGERATALGGVAVALGADAAVNAPGLAGTASARAGKARSS